MAKSPLLGARALRDLFERHGVRPRKELGQNFVIDPNTIRKVIDAARVTGADRVVEIGAGAGSLTLALAARVDHVIAVELDHRLVPVLEEVTGGSSNVTVVGGDVLELDLGTIDAGRMVANLPYNIAAKVVLKALEEAPQIRDLVVMTQKEVGLRLAAQPGSKVFGLTSVLVAYFGRANVIARVSRRAFYPVPGVDSVLVHIERRRDEPGVARADLYRIVRAAFSQRRKMLRRALAGVAGSADAAAAALKSAGIDPEARAEEIGIDEFVAVTKILS